MLPSRLPDLIRLTGRKPRLLAVLKKRGSEEGVQRLTRTHIAEVFESKKLPRFDRVDWISDEKVVCVFKDAQGTKRDAPTGEDAIAAAVYAEELGEAPRKKRRKNKGPVEEEEAPDLLQQMAQKDRELMALKEEVQPEDTPMEGAEGPGTEAPQPEAAEAEIKAPAAPAAPSIPAVDTGEGEAISAVCDVVPQAGRERERERESECTRSIFKSLPSARFGRSVWAPGPCRVGPRSDGAGSSKLGGVCCAPELRQSVPMALQKGASSPVHEGHAISNLTMESTLAQTPLPGECRDKSEVDEDCDHEAGLKSHEPEPADRSECQRHEPANGFSSLRKFSCRCNPFRSLARSVQFGKSAPSINHLSFFSTAPNSVAEVMPLHGKVADVISFQLKRYFQDRCAGGKSALHRFGEVAAILFSLLFLLPVFSWTVCALVPLESPQSGFWSNWTFNLLVHPVLNYVIARGQIEVMARAFCHDARIGIRWIVRLTPLADVSVCILVHLIASLADVYPIPVSPVTVCVRSFVKFNFANWASWLSQFLILAVWTLRFPAMSEHFQALSTIGISLVIAVFGWITQKCGDRIGLPKFLLAELKLCMFFIGLFCSASVMESVKSIRVVFVIAILDAGKALALTAKLLWELVQALEEEDGLYGLPEEDPAATHCRQKLCTELQKHWLKLQHKLGVARRVGQRLRGVLGRIETGRAEEMHTCDICPADARLLKILTDCWASLALVELCELLVPMLYMIIACLLRYVEGNRIYFLQFRHSSFAEFEDGIVGNSIAVAVEVVVFLAQQIWLLRMFGINLFEFTGALIRLDFSFYFFAMALDEQSAVSVICSVLESRPELAPSVVSFSVPDLTYPPIKALVERRSDGFIKSFNTEKGFGFIACEELYNVFGNDVFLVGQQMGSFNVGDEVSFAVALNKDNKPQAYDLRWQHHRNVASGKGGVKGAWHAPQQSQQQQQWGGGKSKGSAGGAGSWGKGSWQPKAVTSPAQEAPTYQAWKPAEPQQQPSWKKRKSDEAFEPPSEAVIGNYSGFIKSFNPSNGYGFIVCQDLKAEGYANDVFLHHAQFEASGLQVGNECEFTVFLNNQNKPQAKDLRPLGGWQ
ncbi:hypothetical protein AK812_SmicGene27158 [Symbiodinium microadriaticum]|uniref:CSD domain-containing protein n=1 Tax=Symbiodinium microadriaticum TaxID=2951 RepID=A0A1Q9D7I3_SYMMI|nr:hypothetical protein AK812_SmicGene27158 [Symbiodinium microadriaticum]